MELTSLLYIDTLIIHLELREGEGERLLNHRCLSLFSSGAQSTPCIFIQSEMSLQST